MSDKYELPYTGEEIEDILEKAENAPSANDIAKIHRVATPMKYGAKGDGATDDTEAFKLALAAERVVYVPGGTYKLTSGIVIGDNCMLELSQDTVLVFENTTGYCINLGMSSNLKGNHATIKVPYAFEGAAIYAYSNDHTETQQSQVPPWTKWDPQWKGARYVTDINICKADSRGFHYCVNPGECKGTAVYISADNTAGLSTYMWGVHYSGIRIAGAFAYGIRATNIDDGWTNDMRLQDVLIDACEIGVLLEDCNNVYVSAIVQPRRAYTTSNVYKPYAKHGFKIIRSKNVDLTGSRIWDWYNEDNPNTTVNEKMTLWTDGGEYQNIALIGDCRGLIVSDFTYYNGTHIDDTRNRIYTDYPSNLEQMTIIQEPITRWFAPIDHKPYFLPDDITKQRLVTDEELAEHFTTEIVKTFTDVLPTATEADGSICGKNGYRTNAYVANDGSYVNSAYYGCTGFIPVKKGDVLNVEGLNLKKGPTNDGISRVILFDADKNKIVNRNQAHLTENDNYTKYKETENGFALTITEAVGNNGVAYVRMNFHIVLGLGENPMIAINEDIRYTVEGFLNPRVKVFGESIIGTPGQITPDWVATKDEVGGDTIIIPEQTITYGMWSQLQVYINAGTTYDVYINGTVYACTAYNYDGGIVLGNYTIAQAGADVPHNNEPFYIFWAGGSATAGMFGEDSTLSYPITLKVTDHVQTVYNKMPEGYLPEGVAMKDEIPKGIPYIEGDSTTAGKWTGTCDGITEYYDGLTVLYKLNVAGASKTTLNINNLGAVEVKRNATSSLGTIYPVGTVVMPTYSDGVWKIADYNVNSKNTAGTSKKDGTKMFLVGATLQTSDGTTTYTNSNVYIGDDNNLYSDGKKVAKDEDVVKTINGQEPDENGNVEMQTGGGTSIDVTAKVGQTIIVNEVDANGKPTKWESADYQPRTHWSEEVEKTIAPQITFEPIYNEVFGIPMYSLGKIELVVGKAYTVIYDGAQYDCTAKSGTFNGMPYIGIGNEFFMGGENNEMPFIVAEATDVDMYIVACMDMNSHTIEVIGDATMYHKIPKEYVQDSDFLVEIGYGIQGLVLYTNTEDITNAILSDKNIRATVKVSTGAIGGDKYVTTNYFSLTYARTFESGQLQMAFGAAGKMDGIDHINGSAVKDVFPYGDLILIWVESDGNIVIETPNMPV